MILALFLKNWRLLSVVVAVLVVLAFLAYVYQKGGEARESEIQIETVKKTSAVQEKKDEIRNNRSFDLYADRLLNGQF